MDHPGRPDELTEEVPDEERSPRVGSADELTDEVVDVGADDGLKKIASPRRREAARAAGGAATHRRRTSSGGGGGKNKALMAAAGVAVLAVVAFFATRSGDSRASTDLLFPTTATSAPAEALTPGEEFAERFATLSADDSTGRGELRAFCIEHDLKEPLRRVQLEILLQDPDDEEARSALGFTRYTGDVPAYQGLWLTDDDLRLAQMEGR